jgi:hypothetical protein
MKPILGAFLLILCLGLTACENTGTYPISGEECGPNDPVQTLDAADCAVPGSI